MKQLSVLRAQAAIRDHASLCAVHGCSAWAATDPQAHVGACSRGHLGGANVPAGYCARLCPEYDGDPAWRRAALEAGGGAGRPKIVVHGDGVPLAPADSSCSSCGAPRVVRWPLRLIAWYGRPWPLRLRVRWPIYVAESPGCGCIKRLKDWLDSRRARRAKG